MPETRKPLKPRQPHAAIVLLWYPLFTQPFIFREVESLANAMPLEVYSLYGINLRHCSREMREAAGRAKAYGANSVAKVCAEMALSFIKSPARTFSLFKRSLFRKWPDWETFGENLWGFFVGVSLGRRFQEEGIDIVYAPWPRGAATAAWVGATIAGIPFAIAARGDNLEPADPDLKDKLNAASLVRANNAADADRIKKFAGPLVGEKTDLIYNSLTLPFAEQGNHEREKGPIRLLALGRFDVTKGFDVLLKACAILKTKKIDFHLTLAGGGGAIMGLGGMEGSLRKMRKDLGLEEQVSMPGLVDHDKLPALLREHDIFVAPCVIHESGRRDGIPNTVIEALALGMPVISTNINALPEVVRQNETGLAVNPGDPQALADAVLFLANNWDFARTLGKNASALAKEMFDPEKNAQRLSQSMQKACQRYKKNRSTCAE